MNQPDRIVGSSNFCLHAASFQVYRANQLRRDWAALAISDGTRVTQACLFRTATLKMPVALAVRGSGGYDDLTIAKSEIPFATCSKHDVDQKLTSEST